MVVRAPGYTPSAILPPPFGKGCCDPVGSVYLVNNNDHKISYYEVLPILLLTSYFLDPNILLSTLFSQTSHAFYDKFINNC